MNATFLVDNRAEFKGMSFGFKSPKCRMFWHCKRLLHCYLQALTIHFAIVHLAVNIWPEFFRNARNCHLASTKCNKKFGRRGPGLRPDRTGKAVTRIYFRGVLGDDTASPVGPKPEARRAEARVILLGKGRRAPSPAARDLEERCKLPHLGPGEAPA